jgi:hypothetical protein
MAIRLSAESEDLRAGATALVVVPLTWLLLGWSWPRCLGGHDELAQNLLIIREVAAGGGWSSLVYRPDLLGGFTGRDALGPFPLFPLLARLGLSPTGISVVAGFVVQALLGFLGYRVVADVATVWGGKARRLTVIESTAGVWLCAFAPVLGWRLGYGHLNIVAGLLPFAAALALLAALAADTCTVALIAASTIAFALGLLHSGQQVVVYGAVFGGPILLGAWIGLRGDWRRLAVPLLLGLGSLLIAWPVLWPMLAHARSSDAPRSLGETVVTYDVVTATAHDWVTSLPWTRAAVPAGREEWLHHEVNYPAGPLLLLLALVPWRRERALAVGLAISLVAVLAFSMDLVPVSRVLLALIPPLRSFRVPARAVLPWLWAVTLFATAALIHHRETASQPVDPSRRLPRRGKQVAQEPPSGTNASQIVGALSAAVLVFLAPSLVREACAWLLASLAVALRRRGAQALPAAAILLVLGAASLAAFRERLLPLEDGGPLLAEAAEIGGAVRRAKPEFESSLARVRLDFEIPAFTVNTAFAAGLSSLDGYEVPTRRFAALVYALRGVRYEPTGVFFKLPADDPAFPVLRQLYNVGWRVTLPARGSLALSDLGPTSGQAWFSASVARVADFPALARQLRESGDVLHSRAAEVLWLVESDPWASRALRPAAIDPRCRDARALRVTGPRSGDVVAEVETEADCPLTLAMNFTEDLRGTVVFQDGRRLAAPVLPGYGALATVLVPAGARGVHVGAEPRRLPWAGVWAALGVACCLGATGLSIRSVRQDPHADEGQNRIRRPPVT